MGTWYHCHHVKSDDVAATSSALQGAMEAAGFTLLDDLQAEEADLLGLSAPVNGWIACHDSIFGRPRAVAEEASRRLNVPVMTCWVYDSDAWGYRLVVGGRTVDQFSSCPSVHTLEAVCKGQDPDKVYWGHPSQLAALGADKKAIDAADAVLKSSRRTAEAVADETREPTEDEIFSERGLLKLGKALGLPIDLSAMEEGRDTLQLLAFVKA